MKEQKKRILKDICFLSFLLCVFIFSRTVIQPVFVVGESMEPTLKEKQLLLADRTATAEDYERGSIVIADVDDKFLIKRIIATPGDTIQIINSDIYINGTLFDDVCDEDFEAGILSQKITLKENEYIILGDNRNNSYDSRDFGAITESDIIAKVIS